MLSPRKFGSTAKRGARMVYNKHNLNREETKLLILNARYRSPPVTETLETFSISTCYDIKMSRVSVWSASSTLETSPR